MFLLPFLAALVLAKQTPKPKGHWTSTCTSETTHECHRRINPNTCANVGGNGVFECQTIKVCGADLDQGVYQFTFGKTGSFAYQTFEVDSEIAVWVGVWDCFCPGDAFQLYVDDIPVNLGKQGKAALVEQGGRPLQPFCRPPLFSDSPLKCFVNHEFGDALDPGHFAGDQYLLEPGQHTITIQVIQSPFNAGSAFISFKAGGCLDNAEEPCCGFVGCNFWTILQPDTTCPRECGGGRRGCGRY